MSQLVLSREVYARIEVVITVVGDIARHPEWWPNVVACSALDEPGELAPGRRFHVRYAMLGRQLSGLITVTEVAPRRIRYEVEGQVRARFRWEFTATAPSRTRIIVFADYDPPGLLRKVADRLFIERRNAADGERAMDSLKGLLESDALRRIDAGLV